MVWGGRPVWDDWEPSKFEVFMVDSGKMIKKYSVEQTQYLFTCLVANSIRHVKKFFFNRAEVATEPTIAQQVGEFVTEMRRLEYYSALTNLGFASLTNTDMWSNVAVPNAKSGYKWRFTYYTTDGIHQMSHIQAQTLCENAAKMANSDKTIDEEFMEINNGLNNLLRETTALDSLIYRAKELNGQADIVVNNLCIIAENLINQ